MDEVTPHSDLDFTTNGHSPEYKQAILAARALVDLAKHLRTAALSLDQLEGLDRVTAVAEVQTKIKECAAMLNGPDNVKHDDRVNRERPLIDNSKVVVSLSIVILVLFVLFALYK